MNHNQNARFVKADRTPRRFELIREIHALNQAAKSAQETDPAFARQAYQKKAEKLDSALAERVVRFVSVTLEASDKDRWHLPLRELTSGLRRELARELADLDRLEAFPSQPPDPELPRDADRPRNVLPIKPPTPKPVKPPRW